MDHLKSLVGFPGLSYKHMMAANLIVMAGLLPLMDARTALIRLWTLLGLFFFHMVLMVLLNTLTKRHPSSVQRMQQRLTTNSIASFSDCSKLTALGVLAQTQLSQFELARMFVLWVVCLIAIPLLSGLVQLALSLAFPSARRLAAAVGGSATPEEGSGSAVLDSIQCAAVLLNPKGRTFTGVPPEEQIYREFKPPREKEKTSAKLRETSVTPGTEGATRCVVIDEGKHFNRTARGCLLSTK